MIKDSPHQQQQQPATRGGRGGGRGASSTGRGGAQAQQQRRPTQVGELADTGDDQDGDHAAAAAAAQAGGRGRGRGRGRPFRGRCFLCGEAHSAHECPLQAELHSLLQSKAAKATGKQQQTQKKAPVQTVEDATYSFASNNPYALLYPEGENSGNE